MENSIKIPLKTRNKSIIWPNNTTIGHTPWENHSSKRQLHHNVHCSTIYKSQNLEATKMSITRWMDKEGVVHVHDEILVSHKKEQTWISSTEMAESRTYYTEWSKSERGKQILYFNACTWNLEKWYLWTYLQGSSGNTDVENGLVDPAGEGEGGTNGERNVNIHTP